MATRVIDDTKLQNIAVAIQSKDNGGQMTVDEMAGRIDNIIVAPVPVQNPALILWDWKGTKLAEYSREDALALTELPNPNTLAPYDEAAHVFLTFYEWNWDLTDAQDWIRKHKNVPRDIGAIFLTTDGETHDERANSRLKSNYTIKSRKRASAESLSNEMQDHEALKYYSLPPNIKHLNGTFYTCYSLQHLNVPKSIESIRTSVFYGNHSLRKIILPKKYISIWTNAFEWCTSLDEIELFNVINLNSNTFNGCKSLTKIHLPSTLQNIYEKVFSNCISLCDILNESKAVLTNVNAFDGLPTNYYIYVPRTDLSWFETETNWSTIYAQGHIVAIEDHIQYLESIGFDVEAYKEAV